MKRLLTLLLAALALLAFTPRLGAQQTHPILIVNRSGGIGLQYQSFTKYVGQGKPTLLYFWGSRYEECWDEAVLIESLHRKYKGLTVLGIPMDGEIDDTKAKMKELGLTYPQLFDMDDEPSGRYDLDGLPYVVLLKPDGTVSAEGLHGSGIEEAVAGCF